MSPIVIGIVTAAVSAALAAALGTIGGMMLERRRSRNEDKRRHLDEIRREVLEPLLNRIESYCRGISGGQKSPIEIVTNRHSDPIGDRDSWEKEWIEDFAPLKPIGYPKPGSYSSDHLAQEIRDTSHGKLNRVLYEHAKDSHFSDLFERYEIAEESLKRFQDDCVEYARAVMDRLSEELDMHIGKRIGDPSNGGGLSRRLGTFILERQLGLSTRSLYIREDPGGSWFEASLMAENEYYAFGNSDQIKACAEAIKSIFTDDNASHLKQQRQEIDGAFAAIENDLKVAKARMRLPSSQCSYI